MQPTLFLGPFAVSSYRLLRLAGVAVLVVGVVIRLRRGRWPATGWDVLLFIPFLQIGLLLGASLEVALPYLADHLLRGTPLPPGWWGGQRALGALAGGAVAGYFFCRFRHLPMGRSFDLFALPLPLGIAVARIGCLMQGCCYGREASTWPAMVLPDVQGLWASRYPTQLASILANLAIFGLILGLEWRTGRRTAAQMAPRSAGGDGSEEKAGHWPFAGAMFLLFIGLHCAQRFAFEFWRADSPLLVGSFSWTHLYCAAGMGLAAWGLVRGLRRSR